MMSLSYFLPAIFAAALLTDGAHGQSLAQIAKYEVIAAMDPMSQGKNKGPSGAFASDAAGNLYGVTYEGGADGQGTLFRINPITGELVTLVEFTGSSGAARGQNPIGGLVSDGKGGFLGATYHEGYNGAPWDNGTVFRYHPGTHTFTSLALFTGDAGAVPGRRPGSSLVPDGAGNFFGTASAGGVFGRGVVYKVSDSGVVTTVANFDSPPAPSEPHSSLLPDGTGGFLGTTRYGGGWSQGTVYRVDPLARSQLELRSLAAALSQRAQNRMPDWWVMVQVITLVQPTLAAVAVSERCSR